ncbi:MAG: outer membrane beta-barrel protein [Pseudorhodoplanes sp.]|uniref:outer membrane beta-barrel protein n=1 Tax=Pseudorhodoplanes sp. TaxID=1934341 RepID=UPI003D13EF5B
MARSLVPITVLLIAALVAAGQGFAQQQPQRPSEPRDPSTPTLFDPHFDSGRTQQFRRPGQPARAVPVTMPTSGAGETGFDATNARVNRKRKDAAQKRARADAENLPPIAATGPDRTVAPVFQRQESRAAQRRRATNSAPIPLDATGVVAARPIRKRVAEEDPFGPVGFYRGSFLYKPALEFSGGYNSNPGQRLNGKGSSFEKIGSELSVKSDWSRHELSADLRGSYIWYNDNDLTNLSKPDIDLKTRARLDLTKQTQAELEGKFALRADNPGDPNLPTDVSTPPMYIVPGGSAAITHRLNRLELSLKGSIERTAYGDAVLNNGDLLDLRDRNYNQYTLRTRAAYETLPGIKPFVEYGSDQRRHDRQNDAAGIARDSNGRMIKAGTQFELTGYLIGEASIGLFEREYKDPIFPNIQGPLFDASLTYYPSPLTTLKLEMKTTVDESILPGVAGSLRHDYGLQIDHAFRRWLIGTVTLGYGNDDYEGSDRLDNRYIVAGALLFKMSREIHFKAEARREWLKSTFEGQDYTSNIFTVGLRLQR